MKKLTGYADKLIYLIAGINVVSLFLIYHLADNSYFISFNEVYLPSITYIYIAYILLKILCNPVMFTTYRRLLIDFFIIAFLLIFKPDTKFIQLYLVGRQIFVAVRDITARLQNSDPETNQVRLYKKISSNPPVFVLASFLITIIVGAFLLSLPWAVNDYEINNDTNFLDALFTATSATCVTGLIVHDTGTYYSQFGQLVILLLIQVGGLGIMTISTAFAILLGQKMSARSIGIMQDVVGESTQLDMMNIVKSIFFVTIFFEFLGAVFLYLSFPADGAHNRIYNAVFHSISAFCNAGFSLYSDSLEGFKTHSGINFTVMGLIITGGIGFTVIKDIQRNCLRTFKPSRLSLHSKIVLLMTVLLIVIGIFAFLISEFNYTLKDMNIFEKLLASSFQSVTTRTAGFNTVNNGDMSNSSVLTTILLMFIGASPGSTGGGIKTTTFAVIILAVLAIMQGGDGVSVFKRRISDQVLKRVMALIAISITFLFVMIYALLMTETGFNEENTNQIVNTGRSFMPPVENTFNKLDKISVTNVSDSTLMNRINDVPLLKNEVEYTVKPLNRIVSIDCSDEVSDIHDDPTFSEVIFEAVSAFGTVGLSMGITSDLSSPGKIIIVLLMYLGRVGPLTFIFALSEAKTQKPLVFTEEKIVIG